ncbi:MAG: hypothetical protein LBK73_03580 [Treponema sp.]|jgi:hypothetical protein|nr:hypothetical protein [Treponema sp.]
MSDNKYKLFRNFMVNELGIGKDDIEEWAKQAVAETVEKIVRQKNWDDLIEEKVKAQFRDTYTTQRAIKDAIAEVIERRLILDVKIRE